MNRVAWMLIGLAAFGLALGLGLLTRPNTETELAHRSEPMGDSTARSSAPSADARPQPATPNDVPAAESTSDEVPPPSGPTRGRVIGSNGQPVGGHRIDFVPSPAEQAAIEAVDDLELEEWMDRFATPTSSAPLSIETNAQGEFSIDLLEGVEYDIDPDLESSFIVVDGIGSVRRTIAGSVVTIFELPGDDHYGRALQLNLIEPDGRPVASAFIDQRSDLDRVGNFAGVEWNPRSDVIRVRESTTHLVAFVPGYAPEVLPVPPHDVDSLDVHLRPLGSIEVRSSTDEIDDEIDGRFTPVQTIGEAPSVEEIDLVLPFLPRHAFWCGAERGASVSLPRFLRDAQPLDLHPPRLSFELSDLPAGTYWIGFSRTSDAIEWSTAVDLEASRRVRLLVDFTEAEDTSGILVRILEATGPAGPTPLNRLRVFVVDAKTDEIYECAAKAVSDSELRVVPRSPNVLEMILGHRDGEPMLTVSDIGVRSATVPLTSANATVELPAARTLELDFVDANDPPAHGKLIDRLGHPRGEASLGRDGVLTFLNPPTEGKIILIDIDATRGDLPQLWYSCNVEAVRDVIPFGPIEGDVRIRPELSPRCFIEVAFERAPEKVALVCRDGFAASLKPGAEVVRFEPILPGEYWLQSVEGDDVSEMIVDVPRSRRIRFVPERFDAVRVAALPKSLASADVQLDDRVVEVDGAPFTDRSDFWSRLATALQSDTDCVLTIIRDGERHSVTLRGDSDHWELSRPTMWAPAHSAP